MRQIIDEYGGAMLALVASIGVLALVAAILLRPGSVVSHGVERMTDGYLSDRLEQSEEALVACLAAEPLHLQVLQAAVAGEGMELQDLYGAVGGQKLRQVRVLNDSEGQWTLEGTRITFPQRGMYLVRVYGMDEDGREGCSYLWTGVGKEQS